MRKVSMPNPLSAARASPESFSSTRLKIGSGMFFEILSRKIKKGTLWCPSSLFSLLFWLGNGDGLAGVADLESSKTLDGYVLAQLTDLGRDKLRDRDGLVLDEGLLVEANLLVELGHLTFHHLLGDMLRLSARDRLRKIDFLLARIGFRRDVFLANELRIASRNVHGNVVHQFLEVLGASDEVALAVDLDQHADLAAGVDIAGNRALAGHAGSLLLRRGCSLLAENHDRLLHVARGLGEGLLAVHHWSAGGVA